MSYNLHKWRFLGSRKLRESANQDTIAFLNRIVSVLSARLETTKSEEDKKILSDIVAQVKAAAPSAESSPEEVQSMLRILVAKLSPSEGDSSSVSGLKNHITAEIQSLI